MPLLFPTLSSAMAAEILISAQTIPAQWSPVCRTHLSEDFRSFRRVRDVAQTLRHVPKADVHHFRFDEQVKLVGRRLDFVHHVLAQLHQMVHVFFETCVALGTGNGRTVECY